MLKRHYFFYVLLIFAIIFPIMACATGKAQLKTEEKTTLPLELEKPKIVDIGVKDLEDKIRISISTDKTIDYTAYKLKNPLRLVVALINVDLDKFGEELKIDKGAVSNITLVQFEKKEGANLKKIARMEIGLTAPVSYKIYKVKNNILIDVDTKETKPQEEISQIEPLSLAPEIKLDIAEEIPTSLPILESQIEIVDTPLIIEEPSTAVLEEKITKTKDANYITDIYFKPLKAKSRIVILSSYSPDFQLVETENPLQLIIQINNAVISNKAQKKLELSSLQRGINSISSIQYQEVPKKTVRIIAELEQVIPYTISESGNSLFLDIEQPVQKIKEKVAAPAPAKFPKKVKKELKPVVEVKVVKPLSKGYSDRTIYTGKRISLDFKDADINDVIRLVAEVSGLNFVAGSEVKGNISITLINVPWDQALDVILKTNIPTLVKIREAKNIMRITTEENIEKEIKAKQSKIEAEIKVEEAKKKLEPLVTKFFNLSYANVKEIEKNASTIMSDRKNSDGFVQSDERTNTLIVKDLKNNIEEIENMINRLDTPTPEVKIEARIVEILEGDTEKLGVAWGATYTGSQSSSFPRTLSIGGDSTTGGTGLSGNDFAVNLPVTPALGALGMTFGNVSNTFNLDIQLTAMESLQKVKILSNPSIRVIQNEEAVINVGSEVPYFETDEEGVTTISFKPVGITLTVTPQVTADNRIFMSIEVNKDEIGETVLVQGQENFTITTKKASTKVLLKDGETAVIGGLFKSRVEKSSQGVPFFSKIPFLGWLFKSKIDDNSRDETLIFLTPTIIKGD